MIMDMPAATLASYRERGQNDAYTAAFLAANFQSFIFRLRSKAETFNEETRVRHTVVGLKRVRRRSPLCGRARECAGAWDSHCRCCRRGATPSTQVDYAHESKLVLKDLHAYGL